MWVMDVGRSPEGASESALDKGRIPPKTLLVGPVFIEFRRVEKEGVLAVVIQW